MRSFSAQVLFLTIFFSLLYPVPALLAQERQGSTSSCADALQRAEDEYRSGAFRSVLGILLPCAREGLSEDDLWRAHRLEALSYFYLDQPDSAAIAIEQLVKEKPFYTALPGDSYEFTKSMDTYSHIHRYSVGILIGAHLSEVIVLQANTITQTSSTASSYSAAGSQLVGIEAVYNFNPFLSLGLETQLFSLAFTRTTDPLPKISSQYNESAVTFRVPLFIRLQPAQWKLSPFLDGGFFGAWRVSNTASSSLTGIANVPYNDLSVSDRRKNFDYGFIFGTGMEYNFSQSQVVLSARYWNGLLDLTKPAGRYSNPALFQSKYYVDDDIALRGWDFSLGFNFFFGFHAYRSE